MQCPFGVAGRCLSIELIVDCPRLLQQIKPGTADRDAVEVYMSHNLDSQGLRKIGEIKLLTTHSLPQFSRSMCCATWQWQITFVAAPFVLLRMY
eukprot:scaffold90557_cov14-Prasinocladus_malaysianus.AAC.2